MLDVEQICPTALIREELVLLYARYEIENMWLNSPREAF